MDWKKPMIKYLEEKGKKELEETADDGIIEYDVDPISNMATYQKHRGLPPKGARLLFQ